MKHLILTIALLACLPVFAQDQQRSVPGYNFYVYGKVGSYRITAFEDRLIVTATSMQRVGDLGNPACLFKLTGNVEIRTNDVIVQADEADYHCSTGEIEPRGNVHVNIVPR
jgi:hypothetical protein